MPDTTPRMFTFDACLGRGGFGEVYRAKMVTGTGLVSDVAIKVLRVDVDPFSQSIARLRDEGRLLAALNHPAILRVVDLVLIEDRIGLVMEYVEGIDLAGVFKSGAPMPLSVLLELVGTLAGALDAAWTSKSPDNGQPMHLVHRDIKPANIRISRHGHVKLLDFGIARSDEMSRDARTVTDTIIGSPPYMAPERFLEPDLRAESDLFALGCCLYEGIARERFHNDATMRRMSTLAVDRAQYATHLDQRLQALPPETPATVSVLLRRLLAYRVEHRGTAAQLAAVCDAIREDVGGVPLSRWAREREWPEPKSKGGLFEGRTVDEAPLPATPIEEPRPVFPTDGTPTVPVERIHTQPGPTLPSEGPTMPLGRGKPSEAPVRRPATPAPATPRPATGRPSTPRPPASRSNPKIEQPRSILVVLPVVAALLGVLLLVVAAVTGMAMWHGAEPPLDEATLGGALPTALNPASPPILAEADAPPKAKVVAPRPPPSVTAPSARVVADLDGFAVWVDGPGGLRPLPEQLEPGTYKVTARPPSGAAIVPSAEIVVSAGDTVRVRCRPRLDGCETQVGP